LNLDRCEGSMPTPDSRVELRWRKDGGQLRDKIFVPAGYRVEMAGIGGPEIVREP
jgi:glucose dehydrogenase